MSPDVRETMVVVVFASGEIVTASIEEADDVSHSDLLAPKDFPPVDMPLTLLRLAISLLPESVTKFHAFKAFHSGTKEWNALNDRMKAVAEPSNDELPF